MATGVAIAVGAAVATGWGVVETAGVGAPVGPGVAVAPLQAENKTATTVANASDSSRVACGPIGSTSRQECELHGRGLGRRGR